MGPAAESEPTSSPIQADAGNDEEEQQPLKPAEEPEPATSTKRSKPCDEEDAQCEQPAKRPRLIPVMVSAALMLPVAACAFARGFFNKSKNDEDDEQDNAEESDASADAA